MHEQSDLIPHHWPNPEFECQSNDWDVFRRHLLAMCAARGFSAQVLGKTGGEPIYLLERAAGKPAAPHLIVASGFHGEEPAGPWGLLKALITLDEHTLDCAHLAVLPVVNVTGFARGTRLNHRNENPNRGFLQSIDGIQASEEGAILLAHATRLIAGGHDGVLSCHEDQALSHAYVYANAAADVPGELARALCRRAGEFFPLHPDGVVDGANVKDGIVLNQTDSSFESWLLKNGAVQTYCTETPGQHDFDQRVSANAAMIALFIGQDRTLHVT
jgi:predicted deacylase